MLVGFSSLARLSLLAFGVWCAMGAAVARAETRRIAIVVGNNRGDENHPALRFAETDAGKIARVLVELGNVSEDDVLLLQGRSPAQLLDAIRQAGDRARRWHDEPDVRVLLFFYFSGHSDGKALELGSDRLTFDQLKKWVAQVNADVRLLVVDSCNSGSLLQTKGGTRVSPFEIRLSDDLPNSGEALISSSAANESALESAEIRGSFFTHYLVSGMRGAADVSGDGRVTLEEAYEYAFAHTMSATAATASGVQHPSYDYRLSGQGELVLTSLSEPSATLALPPGYDRVLITNLLRDEIVVELNSGAAQKVALRPGRYSVRAWRDGRLSAASVQLAERAHTSLQAGDLIEVQKRPPTLAKGDLMDEPTTFAPDQTGRSRTFVAFGGTTGVARDLGAIPAVRLGLRPTGRRGFVVNVDGAAGESPTFTEYRVAALIGYGVWFGSGRYAGFVSASAGGGMIGQTITDGRTALSPTGVVSPSIGGAWWITRHLALGLEGDLSLAVYQRDSHLVSSLWPVLYGGVEIAQ